jgi:eukaryotic-like serine/threonine-protein kinase
MRNSARIKGEYLFKLTSRGFPHPEDMKLGKDALVSHYRIVSPIGKGGMGEVYLAQDTKLDRKVALKILPSEFAEDADRMSRFVREAKSASALNHPNIITIYEIGESDGTHFIATEFIDGKTLTEYAKANRLDYKSVLEIALQVASALQIAHAANIVHRDIKPDNVMIRADGLAKILDFGIAKLNAPPNNAGEEDATAIKSNTQAGMIIGTANYMSPEQAAGKAVDARSDIFSFGVVLYEMLSGHLPFAGGTVMEMIGAILHQEPQPLGASVPPEIKRIVGRCLKKNRDERYQTITEVCRDLREFKQESEFQEKFERTGAPNRTEAATQIFKARTTAENQDAETKSNLKSLVVMPFANLSADAENEYFSDGLTEEIISDLSKIRALRVISRNSAMRLKGTTKDLRTITEELNVRYVLDGSVRKAGQSLRIAVQLIDGERDANLWAEKYSGTLEDIFEMQESVSRSIAEALEITLTSGEIRQIEERPIADARAYDLYLRARAKLMQGNPAALDRSIELLKQGLEIIGENELLYAALGYTYYFYFKWISKLDENYLRLANECKEKVFALNPASTHGYTLKGFLSYSEGDVAEAVRSLKKAVEIEPTNAEALLWLTIYSQYFEDNRAEAIEYADAVRRIDPLLPVNTLVKGFVEIYSGNFGAVPLSWIERGLQMDTSAPLSIWLATIGKAWCGKTDESVAHADRLAEIAPGWVYTEHALFLKHALRGEKEFALAHYTEDFEREAQHDCHFALHVAHCFALIHENEKALDFLETSVRKGMLNYSFISKFDPLLENIRHEKRFKDLIEEAKRLFGQVSGVKTESGEEEKTQIFKAQPTAEKSPASNTDSEEGFWVAVLPFKYRGTNPDLEALTEGLSEEIITGLSRFSYLRVIARSSTLRFTSETSDVRAVGRELGARYVMEGSLRQAGAMLRVAVQLVDAATGAHLWAETYDRQFAPEQIFAIQDELIPRIVSTVADWYGVLPKSMSEIVRLKSPESLSPYDALLRLFGYNLRITAEDHLETRNSLEQAVKKAPGNADCWAMLSTIYADEYKFGYNRKPDSLKRALSAALRAVESAPSNPYSHYALAQVRFFRKEFVAFHSAAERAIELNPMDGAVIGHMGILTAYAGDWDRGCELVKKAMSLNPHHPGWYWIPFITRAYAIEKDYERALSLALKYNMPGFFYYHLHLAVIYGHLGENKLAERALRDLLELKPDIAETARDYLGMWYSYSSDLIEHQIEGLRKAGLKIAAAPNQQEPKTQLLKAASETSETENRNSIAVLPFTDMSAEGDHEYFCDGLAEELLNALAKIDELKVAARTSAFSFKGKNANASEIGERLNVKNVLEGSVRRSGSKLRISVQLVNAADGYHIWSERYDREMRDIFDVQDEIALAVVDALKLKLFGEEKAAVLKRYTDNTEAYELYLKGRFFWSKLSPAGLEKAIEYFNEAVSIEPDFALAYAGLADSYAVLSQVSAIPVSETMPKAKAFAEKALSLDADLAEAHVSLGLVFADYDYDFVAAEKHYQTAIRLNPNNASPHHLYGQLLAELGRHREAEAELCQAIKIDPLSIVYNWQYGFGLFQARRYDEAIVQLNKTAEMDSSFSLTQWAFACIHQARGDYPKTAESFAKYYELAGNSEDAALVRKSFADNGWMGFVRMMTGEHQPDDVASYLAATLHASLGEKDAAFAKLERAYENREWLLALIKIDPRIDSLRDDPRFTEILHRIGFPPEKVSQTDESLKADTALLSSGELKTEQSANSTTRNGGSEIKSGQTTNPKSEIQNPKSKWWLFGLLGLVLIVSTLFAYRYLTPTSRQIESIAVIPFVNESGNQDVEYLSDGMTETLISSLSQLPNLNVKPRSSVFRYKGKETNPQTIGKELNVQAILNGRVVQRGKDISLFVELIDISLDKVVWSETYNRKQSDLVALQTDIARDVSGKIKNKLSGEDIAKVTKTYTTNPEAYQLYLKGNFYLTKYTEEGYRKGIEYYQKAIAIDPNYALAYHGIAAAYDFANGYYLPSNESEPKAKAAAVKALELDETLAETHFLLGKIVFWYEWDWATAERHWKRANELDPTYPADYPPYLAAMGRFEEAIKGQEVLLQRMPLDLNMNLDLALILLQAGKYDQSIEQTRKALELDAGFWWSYQSLGLAYERKRRYPEAIAALEKARQLDVNPLSLGYVGYVYAAAGKKAEAQKTLEELKELSKERYVSQYNIACIYAGLNDKDQAFQWLEHAYQERSFMMALLKVDIAWDNLRDDPRFKDLLRRMNLPE